MTAEAQSDWRISSLDCLPITICHCLCLCYLGVGTIRTQLVETMSPSPDQHELVKKNQLNFTHAAAIWAELNKSNSSTAHVSCGCHSWRCGGAPSRGRGPFSSSHAAAIGHPRAWSRLPWCLLRQQFTDGGGAAEALRHHVSAQGFTEHVKGGAGLGVARTKEV